MEDHSNISINLEEINKINNFNNIIKINNNNKKIDVYLNNKNNFTKQCNYTICLKLISSIIPDINEFDENKEKCICNNSLQNNEKYFIEEELISNVLLDTSLDSKIQLFQLLLKIKKLGYPVTGSIVYYYNINYFDRVLVGSDPVEKSVYIPVKEGEIIQLECKCFIEECFYNYINNNLNCKNKSINNKDMSFENNNSQLSDIDNNRVIFKNKKYLNNLKEIDSNKNNNINLSTKSIDSNYSLNNYIKNKSKKQGKRTKERKIGFIIEKVNAWRKLYNGFYNEENIFIKYSLDDAAKILNISKKSLDDYLLQLRLGRKYGFDFNNYRYLRVGALRSYIKNQKESKENS